LTQKTARQKPHSKLYEKLKYRRLKEKDKKVNILAYVPRDLESAST
jgi:hypothetical protein